MNCSEFLEIAAGLARGESFPGGKEHASSCAGCAAHLADQRALSAGLRALADGTSLEAPAHLEMKLREAWRSQPRKRGSVALWVRFVRAARWGWIAAAAAAALFLTLAVPRWNTRSQPPQPIRAAQRPTAPPIPAANAAQSPTRNLAPAVAPVARRRPRPRRNIQPLDFEALRYDTELTPLEGGQVVRVRLALDQPSGATVQADVLVGEDGMARAIRFVP